MFFVVFWIKSAQKLKVLCSFCVLFLILFYKAFLSNLLGCGGACRFYPSCSEYAFLVYKKYPFLKASKLVLKRLLDCRPFGPKFRAEAELFESSKTLPEHSHAG